MKIRSKSFVQTSSLAAVRLLVQPQGNAAAKPRPTGVAAAGLACPAPRAYEMPLQPTLVHIECLTVAHTHTQQEVAYVGT